MAEKRTETEVVDTPVQQYFLSEADFQRTLSTPPIPYQAGDRITRENFVPFLISAFAISMGLPEAFNDYFYWLRDNEQFDGKQTIENFLSAGGWNTLSEEEKTLFFQAVHSRKRHAEVQKKSTTKKARESDWKERNFDTKENVGEELAYELERLFDFVFSGMEPIVWNHELKGMPLQELIRRIKAWKKNPPKYQPEYAM